MHRGAAPAPKRTNPLEHCAAEKERYDACFKHWYSAHFLKGRLQMSDECEHRFEELQLCVNAALQRGSEAARAPPAAPP